MSQLLAVPEPRRPLQPLRRPTPPLPLSQPGQSSSSGEYSDHVLRSENSYTNPVRYAPSESNRRLVSLVNDAYKYWIDQKPIPAAILRKVEAIGELTADQFLAVFCNRETPQVRAIELIDGRVRFRERDTGPHAGAIMEMLGQMVLQDPRRIFYNTTNFDVVLGNDIKLPDASFSARPARLPNGGAGHTFQIDPNNGQITIPIICFEIAIGNETLVKLLNDAARYFQPGTQTRYWMGIKVFRNSQNNPTNRWWAGHALRDQDPNTGAWLNTYTFQPGSMARNLNINADINVAVPGLQFSVSLATLLHPLPIPPGYPANLVFDIEEFRQIIVEGL